ncbi:MAG: hypothetical protein HY884_06840 [Deltaproteobacteria bacterium]|nr:hypothetical protein [Deltaproteobacteria bacterium]
MILSLAAAGLITYGVIKAHAGSTDLRKTPRPETYGNVVMDKTVKASAGVKPVVFSHWSHRTKYACRVCHTDQGGNSPIGFPLNANTVDIKQSDIEGGKFCGACHNGNTAFGPKECDKCHTSDLSSKKALFDNAVKDLPKDHFGNMVNWVVAAREQKIKPAHSLDGKGAPAPLDTDIVIPTVKFKPSPPDVLFPHKTHTELLDCISCHAGIFQQKKGGNPDMNMMGIISGKYCGVCHGAVSFPLADCFRCHSQPVPPMAMPKMPAKDAIPAEKTK